MIDSGSTGTAAARFAALYNVREPFCIRARQAAALTKPFLMPPLGFNSTMQLPTPYQSLGARGVRNLASKLLLALFPTNTTFFKYEIADDLLKQLTQSEGARGAFEQAMAARERAIGVEMNQSLFRVEAYTALELLVGTGNALVFVPPDKGRCRVFRLDMYVVRRDPNGNLLEIVVRESVNIETLAADRRKLLSEHEVAEKLSAAQGTDALKIKGDTHKGTGDKNKELYTRVYRAEDGDWVIYQECCGVVFPDSVGTYPADKLPWHPLRWSSQPGEDYGRGYVEEFLGDLDSLEALSQTLVEGIAAVARVVFLVKPNGVTRVKVVASARNGDVRVGNAEDVTIVQAQNKSADFQTAQKQAEAIATRISYAFMLQSSIQRNADRVTAEEIRFMAGELDDALGGVYTLMAGEFQLPVVRNFERRMEKRLKAPSLPKDVAEPTITTGLAAIGRGTDLQNLKAFIADVVAVLGPQAQMYLDLSDFLKRASAAYGIDPGGLVRTNDQVAAIQQQQQQAAMVQQLGPNAIRAAGGIAQTAQKQSAEQAPEGEPTQ
jgi:hypothetical protein